jgi:hypothetical protein
VKNTCLIIAFLFLLKPVLPVFEYAANYKFISRELCENKNKPQMHCNGKCHLMKELAKASEQEKPVSEKKTSLQTAEVLFLEPIAQLKVAGVEYAVYPRQSFFYCNLYTHIGYQSVFHPPTFIS